jgi:hypothetical protein
MEKSEKSSVPEPLREKLKVPFRDEVYDLEEANEERSIREAEVRLSTRFLMSPGIGRKIGLTRAEEDAIASMVLGGGYTEQPRVDPQAEAAQARKDASAAVFEEEEKAWKSARR